MKRFGDIYNGFDIEKIRNILNIGKLTEKECKNCWAIRFCRLCAAYADKKTEFSISKKKYWCKRTIKSVDEELKDYCTLKEYGYKMSQFS